MEAGNSLHEVMAAAARAMQDSDNIESLMQTAVDLAVRDVVNAEAAALTIVQRNHRASTPAATHESARHADQLQYDAGEGPCLSAVWEHPLIRVDDIATEDRWPGWVAAMVAKSGYRSMLVLRVFTAQDRLGALNLYATRASAFDQEDVDHAEALAAHIAVAVRAAREIEGLTIALDGRTVVGQAQGLLMERFGLDPAGAFALLTRVSSQTNRKLRHIAQELVETRHVSGVPRGAIPPKGVQGAWGE